MDKYKLVDNDNTEKKDNTENNIIINKLYSNDNITEKQAPKPEFTAISKFKDAEESEKYIKEMHELADKNELKNNLIVIGLAMFVIVIIVFSLIMNTSFAKDKAAASKNEVVTKNPNDSIPSDVKPSETAPVVSVNASSKFYEFLNVEENRVSTLDKAIELNNGSKRGITVYLLSEILRSNAYDIPSTTSSVNGLVTVLTSLDFKKNTDFTQLEKGDICFTTDLPGKPGTPSHAYIFMGWVEEGKTDYANICDGQVEDFGNILHKRNVSIAINQRDQFSFFLEK